MERPRTELLGGERYRHRRAQRIRREIRGRGAKQQGDLARRARQRQAKQNRARRDSIEAIALYAERRTALSTNVLPSDQIAPGTLWLEAITESNAVSIHLQSSSVMVSDGNSLMVWLPWPETCVSIF